MSARPSYRCPVCGARAIECAEIAIAADSESKLPYSLGFDCAGYYGSENVGCGAMLVVTWRDVIAPPIVQTGPLIHDKSNGPGAKMAWEQDAFDRAAALGDLFAPLPDGFVEAEQWTLAGNNGAGV
jgi:hypothetical protein